MMALGSAAGGEGLARAAHRAAMTRLTSFAAVPGVTVRRGDGWLAVRTGIHSNDMNGVISDARLRASPDLVEDLVAWFAVASMPASWLTYRRDAQLTEVLMAEGLRAERTGVWSGRSITPKACDTEPPWHIVSVRDVGELDRWLRLAAASGWISDSGDFEARRRLYLGLGLTGPLRHWLACERKTPIGFASSFLDAGVIDLCTLGVHEGWRRRGVGRALVSARIADGSSRGATLAVSAPSSDGWQLQRTLDFRVVPVEPDTWFYLPTWDQRPD